MHPLPRDSRSEANELDNDLNANPNQAIFRQADNGVLVRMALFALTLGIADVLKIRPPVPCTISANNPYFERPSYMKNSALFEAAKL